MKIESDFMLNIYFDFDEKQDRLFGFDLKITILMVIKAEKNEKGNLYGISKQKLHILIRECPDFDSLPDASPIEVCPTCHQHDFFDTEWGLWCPNCHCELKESDLIYE